MPNMRRSTFYWGYEWLLPHGGCVTSSGVIREAEDDTIRALVSDLLARQRGSTISYKSIVKMLLKHDIRTNPTNPKLLKALLEDMGLAVVGHTHVTNTIYRIPSD